MNEWNTWAREIFAQKNQNRIESFVEPFKIWFKPTTNKFSGKTIFEKYVRGPIVFNFRISSKQGVICEQGDNVENSGE